VQLTECPEEEKDRTTQDLHLDTRDLKGRKSHVHLHSNFATFIMITHFLDGQRLFENSIPLRNSQSQVSQVLGEIANEFWSNISKEKS
jgi:hypothetical protein